ncbi:MAG: GNAT family N-acetyltransferase [Anaerolineae bacterium]
MSLDIQPLTADRWEDFEKLFGPNGACAGCWCMWWKWKRSEWDALKGTGAREAHRSLVKAGQVTGLLAYQEGEPMGWCAVEPREHYPALNRSRVLKPVDDRPVWSVTCFFVWRSRRRKGITLQLLRAAVAYAAAQGARIIEGYPVEPKQEKVSAVQVFTGLASTFRQAGFREVERRSDTRPIMRYTVKSRPHSAN